MKVLGVDAVRNIKSFVKHSNPTKINRAQLQRTSELKPAKYGDFFNDINFDEISDDEYIEWLQKKEIRAEKWKNFKKALKELFESD